MSGLELTGAELDYLHEVMEAARTGQTAHVAAAVASGVPVNLTNAAGDSLLILACYYCHLDTVEMLLAGGADTERINDRGQTALAAAVFRRSEDIVSLLLAAGADPHAGARSAHQIATFFDLADMSVLLAGAANELAGGADELAGGGDELAGGRDEP